MEEFAVDDVVIVMQAGRQWKGVVTVVSASTIADSGSMRAADEERYSVKLWGDDNARAVRCTPLQLSKAKDLPTAPEGFAAAAAAAAAVAHPAVVQVIAATSSAPRALGGHMLGCDGRHAAAGACNTPAAAGPLERVHELEEPLFPRVSSTPEAAEEDLSQQFVSLSIQKSTAIPAGPSNLKEARALHDAALMAFAAHAQDTCESSTLLTDLQKLHVALRAILPFLDPKDEEICGSRHGGILHFLRLVALTDQKRKTAYISTQVVQEILAMLRSFRQETLLVHGSFYLEPFWTYGAVICYQQPRLDYYTGQPWFSFFPGECKQASSVQWMTFKRMQHVVHNPAHAVDILTAAPGNASFKGFRNRNYGGALLWWLAPLPRRGDHSSTIPALNRDDSRYGGIRFTFPADRIFAERTSYLLGTRAYKREWSHTVLLTKQEREFGSFGGPLHRVRADDNVLFKKVGAKWMWACSRADVWDWDHAEVAVQMVDDESISFSAAEGVRIDFVTHDDFCVLEKKSVTWNQWDYQQRRQVPCSLVCRCSKEQAMANFVEACRLYDFDVGSPRNTLLLSLQSFFEPQVWQALLHTPARLIEATQPEL